LADNETGMRKIVWQDKTEVLLESFRDNKLSDSANGGNTYDYQALTVLKEYFQTDVDEYAVMRNESKASYYRRMRTYRPAADVVIRAPFPLVFGPVKAADKNISMVHHIDEVIEKQTLFHRLFFNRLKKRFRRQNLVITVSEFWKNYLEKYGCQNVKVIYNSFDISEFNIQNDEVQAFREKYGFTSKSPLIYIGNASRQKGVYRVHNALKDSGVEMIMTGQSNRATDLPVKFLSLQRREYLLLLKACDAVIANSILTEGWNRIAHEALLLGTPVIGSGSGGMRELLSGAGQPIITDGRLPEALYEVLNNHQKYAIAGKNFVGKFDMNYFAHSWKDAIDSLYE
jgi:glycosyltransferase involved in cell wall biosynthesis